MHKQNIILIFTYTIKHKETMTIEVYTIDYHGHEEKCIIADNFTGNGGPDWHLVALGGNNETIFNCSSWDEMQRFIGKFKGIKKEIKIN